MSVDAGYRRCRQRAGELRLALPRQVDVWARGATKPRRCPIPSGDGDREATSSRHWRATPTQDECTCADDYCSYHCAQRGLMMRGSHPSEEKTLPENHASRRQRKRCSVGDA